MKSLSRILLPLAVAIALPTLTGFAQTAPADKPYSLLKTVKTDVAPGGIDYVFADSNGRRLYVPRGAQIQVFDLDSLKLVGAIPIPNGHGVVVDPESHLGLCSGNPAVLFNTETLAEVKRIPAPGADGILFDAPTHHFFILSHAVPNLLVIDSKDGTVAGTVDHLGKADDSGNPDSVGAVEQGATDNNGHLYFDIENQDCIAVVDAKTLKVTGHYDLGVQGVAPGGLGLDAKNHLLFAMCASPATCMVLSADDGKVLATLPIGKGTDGGGFNPATMEAFSSNGDGTLTIIKENSPTSFAVEQTVTTMNRAKTCSLDTVTNNIFLIATSPAPAPAAAAASAPSMAPAAASAAPAPATASASASAPAASGRGRGGRGRGGPAILNILVVGR
jgi:hypothetical protein